MQVCANRHSEALLCRVSSSLHFFACLPPPDSALPASARVCVALLLRVSRWGRVVACAYPCTHMRVRMRRSCMRAHTGSWIQRCCSETPRLFIGKRWLWLPFYPCGNRPHARARGAARQVLFFKRTKRDSALRCHRHSISGADNWHASRQ